MYVRMMMTRWDSLITNIGDLPVKSPTDSIGFLEVFQTKEDLLKSYPDETAYLEVVFKGELICRT